MRHNIYSSRISGQGRTMKQMETQKVITAQTLPQKSKEVKKPISTAFLLPRLLNKQP